MFPYQNYFSRGVAILLKDHTLCKSLVKKAILWSDSIDRVHTRQGNVREIYFFPGQGIVREFYDVSGKNEICKNVREKSGNFTFQPDEDRMFGPNVFFLAKFIKFAVPILSGKFEFTSEKSQGNVREFWSILNV